MSDPNANLSPRDKKLKEEISRLRKKSKENVMKIKCLQGKIRRILHKKEKGKCYNDKTDHDQGLKRHKLFADDESSDPESLPPSPSTSLIEKIDFDCETDVIIKSEPDDERSNVKLLAVPTKMGDNNTLIDMKIIEDDPLLMSNGWKDNNQ